MAKPSDLITIGKVIGVFGIKGWLKIKSFTEPAENIVNYSPLWLKTRHGLKEIDIQEYQFRSQGLILHIRGIDDRNAAEELGRVELAVREHQLAELEEGNFYWHQLLGLKVISRFASDEYTFGTVTDLLETGANDVLVVQPTGESMDDRERLVPFVMDTYIKTVDLETKTMWVEWDPDF